jgi:hypothetical protein
VVGPKPIGTELTYSEKVTGQMGPREWSMKTVDNTLSNSAQKQRRVGLHYRDEATSDCLCSPRRLLHRCQRRNRRAVVQVSDATQAATWKPVWADPRFQR